MLAAGPGRRTVELRARTFTPQQQVAGRVELRGPGVLGGRRRARRRRGRGLDGAVRRRVVEQEERESPYEALRRVLAQSVSVDP